MSDRVVVAGDPTDAASGIPLAETPVIPKPSWKRRWSFYDGSQGSIKKRGSKSRMLRSFSHSKARVHGVQQPKKKVELSLGYGVSLELMKDLRSLLMEREAEGRLNPGGEAGASLPTKYEDMQTRHMCRYFMRKRGYEGIDGPIEWEKAYSEMCMENGNLCRDGVTPAAGPPTIFCSHSWSYNYNDVVGALEYFLEHHPEYPPESTFIWFDCLSCNQNRDVSKPANDAQEWWKATFMGAIGRIGTTVVLMFPLERPETLTRSWCLWEILSSVIKNVNLHIEMMPAARATFRTRLLEDFNILLEALGKVDLENAKATRPEDEESIRKSVQDAIGFFDANVIIKNKLRTWLADEGRVAVKEKMDEYSRVRRKSVDMQKQLALTPEAAGDLIRNANEVAKKEVKTNEELLTLQWNVANLFFELDDLAHAEAELLSTVKGYTKLHDTEKWQEQTTNKKLLKCVGTLGRLYAQRKDKGDIGRAKEYFEHYMKCIDVWKGDPDEPIDVQLAYAEMLSLSEDGEACAKAYNELKAKLESPDTQEGHRLIIADQYARYLKKVGSYEQAFEIYNTYNVEEEMSKLYGEMNIDVLECRANKLSLEKNILRSTDMAQDALKATQVALLEKFENVYISKYEALGQQHESTIRALHDLAKCLMEFGRPNAALTSCEKCIVAIDRTNSFFEANRCTTTVRGDMTDLATEVELTKAKVYTKTMQYKSALTSFHHVMNLYSDRVQDSQGKGYYATKTANVQGEIGYLHDLMGDARTGVSMMRKAKDDLISLGLEPSHTWITKIEKRIAAVVTASGGNLQASVGRKALVMDCGTNESKAMLMTWDEGKLTSEQIGDTTKPLTDYIPAQREVFIDYIKEVANQCGVDTIWIGLTAWFRDLESRELQRDVLECLKSIDDRLNLYAIKPTPLSHKEEALAEANAVQYAVGRVFNQSTDMLIASGGGSIQITLDTSKISKRREYLIPVGFRKKMNELLEADSIDFYYDDIKPSFAGLIRMWVEFNPDFLPSRDANVVCISGAYHGSQTVAKALGVPLDSSIQTNTEDIIELYLKYCKLLLDEIEATPDRKPTTDQARNLCNITLQMAILAELCNYGSKVRFCRDLLVDGRPLRMTWPVGWFYSRYVEPLIGAGPPPKTGILACLKGNSCGVTKDTGGSHFAMGRFEVLLSVTKLALDEMNAFLKLCASRVPKDPSLIVREDSKLGKPYSIADLCVELLIGRVLYSNTNFARIVGKMGMEKSDLSRFPEQVWNMIVPEDVQPVLEDLDNKLSVVSSKLSTYDFSDVTVFVDPLDGNEFLMDAGPTDCCTILVGFAAGKRPCAGIVYRPLGPLGPSFAYGCKSEGLVKMQLDLTKTDVASEDGFLGEEQSNSVFLQKMLSNLSIPRVPVGGCGNKILWLLEGKGKCYIEDAGTSRWQTCAAQAVLEASDACFLRLDRTCFSKKKPSMKVDEMLSFSYTYSAIGDNQDFVPGGVRMTKTNRSATTTAPKDDSTTVSDVRALRPFANVCGVFAVAPQAMHEAKKMVEVARSTAQEDKPDFR